MTEKVEIHLPKLGESIVGATIVHWLKREGERVALDEPLVEVSTDKVNSEIPSPVAGILKEIIAKEEMEICVGDLLATIEVSREVEKPDKELGSSEASLTSPSFLCPHKEKTGEKRELFSPALLRLAREEGISLETLSSIVGSGEGGRVTKRDLEQFIAQQKSSPVQGSPFVSTEEGEERIVLTGMRKAIAENMVRSFYEAPHASLVIEADVTEVMALIAKEKERFFQIHGVKLTITSFLVQAVTKAIQQFPMLNASLDRETIIMKRYVNVGIAVHVEKGLLVPVIKNCQERSLVSLAKAISELAQAARTQQLKPQDVSGGTVTVTNFGMTGALIGVPIIRYPEVAIIGAGTIQKRLIVREDESIAIRQMMYLTLTFDHRVIDGIYGCQFLSTLKDHLESVSLQ